MAGLRLASALAIAFSATTLLAQHVPAQTAWQNVLMPKPASLQQGDGNFVVSSGFTVALSETSSPLLHQAVLRTLKRLEDKTGIPLPRQIGSEKTGSLVVAVHHEEPAVQDFEEDESYTLTTTPTSIRIEASTIVGALHGLETLLQLTQPSGTGYVIPSVTIQDAPRFRWRGLMIDCGRHFEPMEVLKRNIDAMAAVKLNVFHWHLTEDQGFRIQSKLFPKLTDKGSDGLFYTQEDARELVRYARERGIRIVPEFEMPGHSTAWLMAYPELASGSTPVSIRREFGVSDYVLDPTREETYRFVEQFLGEMAQIFPDRYIHIGGDEAPAPDWKKNPRILDFMKAHNLHDNDALQAYFNQRVLAILSKLNRRMIGWDEIFNPALPKDVVVQSWRGEASLAKGAQQGYQGVLSAPYYLDGMRPAGVHYLADPVPVNSTLTADQKKLILGGEVCMWSEHLDSHTIESRIWPRSAAIAERFWSAQSVTDVDDMYRRLQPMSIELEQLGLRHISSEDSGLRELVGSENIDALRTFALAFEPVSFGGRYHQQHTSQLTPLTEFVDAVRPDPPIRHQIEVATRSFLADPKGTSESGKEAKLVLQHFFEKELEVLPRVRQQMAMAPRLQPVQARADQLSALATLALESLHYLSTGTPAPANWKSKSKAILDDAKKPSAIVTFDFLEPLSSLVQATK